MIGILKSLQTLFATLTSDLPEGLRVIFDFLWKIRWFIVCGWVAFSLYSMLMAALPYLMWTYVIKSLFSFFL